MPGPALVDTGPLAAWFRGNDPFHDAADRLFRGFDGELISTWSVVTEVTHLLRPEAQLLFLAWVRKGGVQLAEVGTQDLAPIERLIAKYRDQPMDFADATLVLLAERTGVGDVITLDRKHFDIYRFSGGRRFNQLMPATGRRTRGSR